MYSGRGTRALPRVGFPIRTSRDQRSVSTSPALFAAAHVLHRLLAPRHPPCALVLLIMKNTVLPLWSFQGARGAIPLELTALRAVSQNSTAFETSRSTYLLGEPGHRTSKARGARLKSGTGRPILSTSVLLIRRAWRLRSKSSVFPRKEVIQPQLPLRLPCYDFTPVTDPTFDGSLPCGLGHRLRVLPASVV